MATFLSIWILNKIKKNTIDANRMEAHTPLMRIEWKTMHAKGWGSSLYLFWNVSIYPTEFEFILEHFYLFCLFIMDLFVFILERFVFTLKGFVFIPFEICVYPPLLLFIEGGDRK